MFISLNKMAVITLFSLCAFSGSYAEDDRSSVARGDDRGMGNTQSINQGRQDLNNRGYNQGYQYGSSGYGGAAIYPQYPYVPNNAQTFPDDSEFQNTYERNAHPPQ